MNAQQLTVLDESRAALRPVIQAAVPEFYRRLFVAQSQLEALFSAEPMV